MTPTGSQTVGPFFNFGLTTNARLGVMSGEGERIRIRFRVVDGEGVPTPGDSMIELWQAGADGVYHDGFGRLETQADGTCVFETVKPGRVDGQAPHITVLIFARGLLKQLHTRLYFADDPANGEDPVLALVPEARRSTLEARQIEPGLWHMDIQLQGPDETVFFEV